MYVNCGDIPLNLIPSFAVSVNFKPPSVPASTALLFSKIIGDGSGNSFFGNFFSNGSGGSILRIYISNGSDSAHAMQWTCDTTSLINIGDWNHIVFFYDSSKLYQLSIMLNGNLLSGVSWGSYSILTTPDLTGRTFEWGWDYNNGSASFVGVLDECRVFAPVPTFEYFQNWYNLNFNNTLTYGNAEAVTDSRRIKMFSSKIQDVQSCVNSLTAPISHINGSELSFTGGKAIIIHNVKDTAGITMAYPLQCKGAQVLTSVPTSYVVNGGAVVQVASTGTRASGIAQASAFSITAINASSAINAYTIKIQNGVLAGNETIAWSPTSVIITIQGGVSTASQVVAAAGGTTGTAWGTLAVITGTTAVNPTPTARAISTLTSYVAGVNPPATPPAVGVLMVHALEDPDGVWFPLELKAGGGPVACQFDLVGDASVGSTVSIDASLIIFPCLYA